MTDGLGVFLFSKGQKGIIKAQVTLGVALDNGK